VTVVDPPKFMDAWSSRQQGLAQRPATPVAPNVRRGPRPNYVTAALEGETTAVRQAPKGTRNPQLNTSALKLGRLVGAGLLEEDVAVLELRGAALAAGLTPLETDRTIRSGMRAGIADPRDPGEAQNTGAGLEAPRALPELGAPASSGAPPAPDASGYVIDAAQYLLDLPDKPEPVWGVGDTVLWSDGEALMLAGGPGLGKTTLAGQLARGRLGLQRTVLDMPVLEGDRLVYLAMDRPRQIARRLSQQFTTAELEHLRGSGRFRIMPSPPPHDMARNPDLLLQLCDGADTVVVDSLKDAAIGLTDDEVGAGWNRARQLAVAAGVQVLELHHLVKRGANGKDPDTLADVYGSAWLTAGAGSVVVLLGDAGSPIVKAKHLKPVAEPFGPAELVHDHASGVTTVHHRVNLLELLAITRVQTPRTAACQLFDTDKPSRSDLERARRQLEKLVADGRAVKRATDGGITYHPLTERTLQELAAPADRPFEQGTLED
jgi:hypothetical protein